MAHPFSIRITRLSISRMLMIVTIVLIAAFQAYWLSKLYKDEWDSLKKNTDVAFRDVIYKLQVKRFRKDSSFFDSRIPDNLFMFNVIDSIKGKLKDSIFHKRIGITGNQVVISIETSKRHDSLLKRFDTVISRATSIGEGIPLPNPPDQQGARIVKFFSDDPVANTPLDIKQIDSAYKKELLVTGITVPYDIKMISGKPEDFEKSVSPHELKTNFIFVGLANSYAYQARFGSPFGYIAGKLINPLLVGLLLIAVTTASFVFLYRNLLAQKRLAAVKNEFISNITHELKTPIATVNVAIEALRNFNALQNPERTREYLDISALELQRLSMLVDKVLKLSMFENKEIELKKEIVDLFELAAEVIAGMKLQMEKAGAYIQLTKDGSDFIIRADRLHITSVLYNLIDNALKYSSHQPAITVHLVRETHYITIAVSDNGIGIQPEYRSRIFEKFFRVPSGDHHNIKGYGLGLSYVHHIVTKHGGTITVDSTPGKGSTFTIKLPLT
ncbi:MAG TPA: HAMP domain-containing sensor histidine kinase [Chitinophagaceae bacterium]|nr:HAMP domain-containing sensor histidine kinase [Chitinophagaceae bacterium]